MIRLYQYTQQAEIQQENCEYRGEDHSCNHIALTPEEKHSQGIYGTGCKELKNEGDCPLITRR